jgi:REP element-mobilizing transposase RayT
MSCSHQSTPRSCCLGKSDGTWAVFRELAQRKECQIAKGHLMFDHVHMLISIPPKYSVSEVIGYLKGKSSIWIAQNVERQLCWGLLARRRMLRCLSQVLTLAV